MGGFGSFVIFGAMRTGSNLLEERLNGVPGLVCHGEVFNPQFVGHAGQTTLFGFDFAARDRDPRAVLAAIEERSEGLGGFRLFQDHDPRVTGAVLNDPRAAKIVLTRNPVESYVSLLIARRTGQWWLGDARGAKSARVRFDPVDFAGFLADRRGYYRRIARTLQETGQTAFHVDYADLGDPGVLSGLARWLGAEAPPDGTVRARPQNPASLEEKVENFDEMEAALAQMDPFGLSRLPNFEPERGPGVPGFVVSDAARLLYMPLKGSDPAGIETWFAAFGTAAERGLTQKQLRRWKRQTPGHLSFTVVRDPLERAHAAFCRYVLPARADAYGDMRRVMRDRYGLPLPDGDPGPGWTAHAHRAAFMAFLDWLKANLGGQTSVRADPVWSGQAGLLQSLAETMVPDRVLRWERLADELATLAGPDAPAYVPPDETSPVALTAIRGDDMVQAARSAYPRDYMMFGYP